MDAHTAWKQYSAFKRANSSNIARTMHHGAVPAPSPAVDKYVWENIERALDRGSLRPDILAHRQPGEVLHYAELRKIFP